MKALFLALAALGALAGTAGADKSFTSGKGTTWDCTKDPVVAINHGKGTYTFKGECKTIAINGGHDTLTIESVDELDINGSSNTITAGTVNTVTVNGADNKVTYKKSKGDKPAVTTLGQNNSVTQK